jgi:hypothetical protein
MIKTHDSWTSKYKKYIDADDDDDRMKQYREVLSTLYATITECKLVEILSQGGSAKSRRDKLNIEFTKVASTEASLMNPIKARIFKPILLEAQSVILDG